MKNLINTLLLFSIILGIVCVPSISVEAATIPGKISKVTITKTCPTAVKIKWSKSKGATKYIVYKKTKNSNYKKIKSTTSYTCLANNLTKNRKYTFKIVPCKVINGKTYYGAAKTKNINLNKAKTKTPKLTTANVKTETEDLIRCVARCLTIGAYLDYDYSSYYKIGDEYYNLVTNCNSIKSHRKRAKKYLSDDIYNMIVCESALREKNKKLYINILPTDDIKFFDLNSIQLKEQENGYYNVFCDAYYGYSGEEYLYKFHFKVKYSNGYFKCYYINLYDSQYVGTVTKYRELCA